jgi:hypothetical protein
MGVASASKATWKSIAQNLARIHPKKKNMNYPTSGEAVTTCHVARFEVTHKDCKPGTFQNVWFSGVSHPDR